MPNEILFPFEGKLKPASVGQNIADSVDVEVTLDEISATNVSDALLSQDSRVRTLENTAFNSGRAFITFTDGFTIDRNNIATFEGKNIIYAARNNKPLDSGSRPDVHLPNDAEIQAAGETYPIVFEFTHLGGTEVSQTNNLLRLFVDGTETHRIVRDQIVVVSKSAVGVDYEYNAGNFNPGDTILPSGVFNLKTDTAISDISTIATELNGVTIVAGDAYLVETGGTWSGLTIPNNSILVALVNSSSLVDSPTNDDWLLLDNPRVNAKSAAFLSNWDQDGIAFNGNRNVQVDPANVLEFEAIATGVPEQRNIGGNTQGSRSIRYDNVPIQLADLVGGQLQLNIEFALGFVSGFSPSWTRMEIRYPDFNGIVFDFPLTNAPTNGAFTSVIDIPSIDYSSAIDSNASVILYYTFNGASFSGSYTITNLINSSKGRLHDAVSLLASNAATQTEMRVQSQIDALKGNVDDENQSLEAISDRISPYKRISISTPDVNARFLNSTGVDSFPATIDSMTSVSPENPRFTGDNVALYVAVRPGQSSVLTNITQDTVLSLDDSEATVELGESLTATDGFVYFVYRVTSLTASDVYEVDATTFETVVAWQDDINNLESDIERIDAELEHALLNLSDNVVQVFENEVNVTEESTPTTIASDYNKGLSDAGTQTVFYEDNPNTGSSGVINSEAINKNIANDRYRNKLIYFPNGTYSNQTYLVGFDGTTGIDLIDYSDGLFRAKQLVPSIPSGTAVYTVYPAPSTLVSGAGIWISIPTQTFQNGLPVAEADEIFFTRNVPSVGTNVRIDYRGHSNGNVFGTGNITLPANQDSTSFTLTSGSEQAIVTVLRTGGNIRVSVTEVTTSGLPIINDVEVILSYQEIRTVPGTPATVRNIDLEHESENNSNVFAIKADASNNLIIVGGLREVNTGYLYTDLFDADESGYLIATNEQTVFLDYEDVDVIASTIIDLENHSTLPQFGLFSTEYTHETLLNFDVALTAKGDAGDEIKLGQELVLIDSGGDRWRLSVNIGGALITTKIV